MADELLLAFSTFPDIEIARRIAGQLVTENFVACANIIPAIESIYRWQGKIEEGNETLVLFKTTAGPLRHVPGETEIAASLRRAENNCLRTADGLPEYLKWVSAGCSAG